MLAFVYGTLKNGYGNNRLLRTSRFVSEATTIERFTMINSGFPVVFLSPQGKPVKGEVWDIGDNQDTLRALDGLEGEGVMYDRRTQSVTDTEGNVHECQMYIGNGHYWQSRMGGTEERYDQGDYLEWSR